MRLIKWLFPLSFLANLAIADEMVEVKPCGRLLLHSRFVRERAQAQKAEDTFFIKQARIGAKRDILERYGFKVEGDLGEGGARLKDGYIEVEGFDGLNMKAGQFKVPFSQEELISFRFIGFVDRSIVNILTPKRDIGIMLYGGFLNGIIGYSAGVFNGDGENRADSNDEKDYAMRLLIHPFRWREEQDRG